VRNRSLALVAIVVGLAMAGCANGPAVDAASAKELPVVDLSGGPAFPLDKHLESKDLVAGAMTFDQLFEAGSELFHTPYNGLDGVGGLRLPDGTPTLRFAPFPQGHGALGVISSQSCGGCHLKASSGLAQSDVASDPGNDGVPPFNVRSTTSLMGDGLLQLLAQEMTEELLAVRDAAGEAAKQQPGSRVELPLKAKGIDYGVLAATADAAGNVTYDASGRRGLDPDLVVRPLGWKGNVTTIRSNNVGPAAFLMGMQPEELTWKLALHGAPADADGDGVEREFSVGDITALVVYGAAQETPQSVEQLAHLGLVQAPSEADRSRIEQGREAFTRIGCASCHVPELPLSNTVFEEPTARGGGNYYDHFLAQKDPDYDLQRPIRFDLREVGQQPRVEMAPGGGATVRLFGDLKRHHMGRQLADPGGPQPPITADFAPLALDGKMVLIGADEFLTAELWGTADTGPWMHDARAETLREAIWWHVGDEPPPPGSAERSEAQEARDAFGALPAEEQEALLTFLRSLRTFILPDA
jgi:hypothetical protein